MNGLLRVARAEQLVRVISSQSLSTLSNGMVGLVIPWLVLSRTGSALNAGGVAFAVGAASLVGTLASGVISDRIGGRRAALISDAASFVTVLILPITLLFDFLPIWLVITTQILGTLFDGAGAIGKDTLVPRAAEADDVPLVRATSLQEALQNTANFVGPMAAGLLVAIFSESMALVVVSALFMLSFVLIGGVRKQHIVYEHPLTARQAWRDMLEGFTFLLREPLLKPITLVLVVNTGLHFPLASIIYPSWFVFADQGAERLGFFLGAQAIGGIVGGLLFAMISTKVSASRWFLLTNVASTLVFSTLLLVEPGSLLAIAVSFLMGLVAAGLAPIVFTAYYERTPENLLGRVNGAAAAIMGAAVPVSSILFGWLISATAARHALVVVLVCYAVMALVVFFIPSLKLFDAGKGEEGTADRGSDKDRDSDKDADGEGDVTDVETVAGDTAGAAPGAGAQGDRDDRTGDADPVGS